MVELGTARGTSHLALDHVFAFEHPFPHWIVERAISRHTLDQINQQWPEHYDGTWHKEDGRFNRKWQMPADSGIFGVLATELESREVLDFVARLIGEKAVYPDAGQFGGGLHAIPSGGFLSMHTDFKFHPCGRRRVANILLYVNREWPDTWGGELCLGMNHEAKYLPIGGRMVIFRTDTDSWHGHPEPTRSPRDVFRRSIASYYYTAETGKPDKTTYIK